MASHSVSLGLSRLLDHLLTAYHYPEKEGAYSTPLDCIRGLREGSSGGVPEGALLDRIESRVKKCVRAEYTDDGCDHVLVRKPNEDVFARALGRVRRRLGPHTLRKGMGRSEPTP